MDADLRYGAPMSLTITLIALAAALVAAVGLKIRQSHPPVACPWCKALQSRSASTCSVCGGTIGRATNAIP